MTPVQDAFLSLLRISLGSAEAPPELTAEQWVSLFELAQAHKLLPMVFEAGYGQISRVAPALAASAKHRVRDRVILQTIRTAEFLELYRALTDAGITPLVVKGIVCRQLYSKPDHRSSSDEDLLIPPEQFALCHEVMTRMGFATTEADPENAYEVPYRKSASPLYIELHKHLFPPQSDVFGNFNDFFTDLHRNPHPLEIPGATVVTLQPTDHMTYLLLHAFKHFLHSGFGIRQICDMLLFAHHHNDCIDWAQVRHHCCSVRAEKFAAAVFAVGVKHLGFAPVGGWPETDELPLLEDVLRAGIYGSADRSRQHSSTITLQAASSRKSAAGGILAAAFPSSKNLEGRYPWLKKQPWLLPVAWADRMTAYLRETRTRRDSALADTLKLGTERLALLRHYDILK